MPRDINVQLTAAMAATIVTDECASYNCTNCKAPCCKYHVGVNDQEQKNGHYLLEYPYPELPKYAILARKKDGSCVYQNPDGSCGIYHKRPWICRTYTCEKDDRIDNKSRFETGTPNVDMEILLNPKLSQKDENIDDETEER